MPRKLKKRTQARFLGRMLPGAKPSAEMPGFVPHVAPVLREEVPAGARYLHEVKFDGYRMQVRIDRGAVSILSRAELDWTARFPFLARAFKSLPADRLIMDGEVVSVTDSGASDFGQLQADLKNGKHERIVYFAFDLMFLDGFDLTDAPLIERKKVLKAFVEESNNDRLLYSEHFDDGAVLFQQCSKLGLEGVVSKLASSKYRPSKGAWVKVKCQQVDELTIVGYVPSGRNHIAALRLGRPSGATFDYVGKVGTGFTLSVSERLRKQLGRMHVLKPSLSQRLRKPDTKWVKPELRARVAYRGITGEGKLRHPSFKGLLSD